MFQYHNGILCVEGSVLFDDQYSIISLDNFKKLCQRKHLRKVNTGGNGRKALIEFDSMRKDLKDRVIDLFGNPNDKAKQLPFLDFMRRDENAFQFFHNYTLDSGDALPEKNIKEYTANASVLNAISTVLETTMSKRRALGSKVKPWPKIAAVVQELPMHTWPHTLPANERSLQKRYNRYLAEGYESLIHKQFGRKNAEKINDEAKSWVLAKWCDRVNKCTGYAQLLREYNNMAVEQGWKPLKTEQSLMNYLQNPAVEPLWWEFRFGSIRSKEKFSFQFSTKLPSMRDSLWYSDGTKLNYFYRDENGKVQTCQVYEVFDAYSEVFLGYHISRTEDFEAQYFAFKMAIQVASHKPYEIKFDNQGGHKKLEATSFLGKISKLTTNTQPYNGKSKTIENAFGRFQMQYLKKDWFFTGQNVTTKRLESKPDMEMISRNISELPSLDQVKEIYKQRREEWNAAPHPKTGIARLEMYLTSTNPATPEVSIWDTIDMFWITREKPVTCTAYGINFTEKKEEYQFMVYGEDRMPNFKWLQDHIDEKFIIKYDPADMSLIQLYQQTPLGLRWKASAEPKVTIHRNRQEQDDWEAGYIAKVGNEIKALRVETRDKAHANLEKHGMTPEHYGLRSPLIKGIESSKKAQKQKTDIGAFQKAESNAVFSVDTEEIDIDIHSLL